MPYPFLMRHPNYIPAVVQRPSPGKPLAPGELPQTAHSAIFPEVTVFNEADEEYHRSQGYIGAGETPEEYAFTEYPKWVGDVLVSSAAEEAELTKPAARRGRPPKAKVRQAA